MKKKSLSFLVVLLTLLLINGCSGKEVGKESNNIDAIVVEESNSEATVEETPNVIEESLTENNDSVVVVEESKQVEIDDNYKNELIIGKRYWINSDMTEVFDDIDGEVFAEVFKNDDIIIKETGELWSKVLFIYYDYVGWIKNEYITDINPRPVTLSEFEKKLVGEWIIPESNAWDKRLLSIRDNKTLVEHSQDDHDRFYNMNWEYDPNTKILNCVNNTKSEWFTKKIVSLDNNELVIENDLGEKIKYIKK